MNPKRLVLAIVAVFIGVFTTDYLIHEVWLKSTYQETLSLWRPEAEIQAHFGWLMLGQFLAAATFVILYAKGFATMNCVRCACLFGLFMGLFKEATTLVTYAVQPFPPSLAVKWFKAGVVQGVLMGVLVFFVYKPKPEAGKPKE
jgi:hypothetical protein